MDLKDYQVTSNTLFNASKGLHDAVRADRVCDSVKFTGRGPSPDPGPKGTEMLVAAINRLMPTIVAEARRLLAEEKRALAANAWPLLQAHAQMNQEIANGGEIGYGPPEVAKPAEKDEWDE